MAGAGRQMTRSKSASEWGRGTYQTWAKAARANNAQAELKAERGKRGEGRQIEAEAEAVPRHPRRFELPLNLQKQKQLTDILALQVGGHTVPAVYVYV